MFYCLGSARFESNRMDSPRLTFHFSFFGRTTPKNGGKRAACHVINETPPTPLQHPHPLTPHQPQPPTHHSNQTRRKSRNQNLAHVSAPLALKELQLKLWLCFTVFFPAEVQVHLKVF